MPGAVDVLFVDEAGQISLANVRRDVAGAPTASSCWATRSSSTSRCTARTRPAPTARPWPTSSATRPTIRPTAASSSRRPGGSIPDLCAFTSEVFYDDRLESEPHLATSASTAGRPLRTASGPGWSRSPTTGATTRSPVEAEAVARARAVARRRRLDLDRPTRRRPAGRLGRRPHRRAVQRPGRGDRRLLPPEARVGTVDKFQGQEAPISIYSMTTSSPELAPRGMDFLYSRQPAERRHVASALRRPRRRLARPLRVRARTPAQMRLANAFCRLRRARAPRRAGRPADVEAGRRSLTLGLD